MTTPYRWGRDDRQPAVGHPAEEWMAAGMVALYDVRHGVDVVSGARATSNGAVRSAGRIAVAGDFSGTAMQTFAHSPSMVLNGAMSIVALFDLRTHSGFGQLIGKTSISANGYDVRLGETGAADNSVGFIRYSGGAAVTYRVTPASTGITTNTTTHLVLTAASGEIQTAERIAFINGRRLPMSLSYNGGGTTATDGGDPVRIGRRADGATQFDGQIYYLALFNRALTDAQAGALYARPMSVFRLRRRLWAPGFAATTAGPISGALSLSLDGASASAAGMLSLRASAAVTTDNATAASVGALQVKANAGLVTESAAASAAGASAIAATLAATLDSASLGAAATVGVAAQSAVTTAGATVAAAGAIGIRATAAATLESAVVESVGELGAVTTGQVAATLAGATVTASGALRLVGAASVSLAGATVAASGAAAVRATLSVALEPASVAASGALGAVTTAQVAATLAGATASSAATLRIAGAASSTLAGATVAATATKSVGGAASITLESATASGAGRVLLRGSASVTLADCSISAVGGLVSPITGAVSITLAGASLSAAGTLYTPSDGASDAWTYLVPPDDLRFRVAPDDLRYDVRVT